MPSLVLRQTGDTPGPNQAYLDESNVSSILGLTGAFCFAAFAVVSLRLYVRTHMLHFVGTDDWTMIAASFMALGTFICLCGESQYGMGRHREWQQPWMMRPYLQWLFAHNLLVMWGVLLVKISIAFFLMRIMLQKGWKIFLWVSVSKCERIHAYCVCTHVSSLPRFLRFGLYWYARLRMHTYICQLGLQSTSRFEYAMLPE